jgi:hypothetical protein
MGRFPCGYDGCVFFNRLSTGIFITWTSGVFFTWPSLEPPLLDLLLRSSFDPLCSLLCLTLNWGLLHLTLSGVIFAWPSTRVFFTWPSLESSLLDPLLGSSSLILILSATRRENFRLQFYFVGVIFMWIPSSGNRVPSESVEIRKKKKKGF